MKTPVIDGHIPTANLPKDPVKRAVATEQIARNAMTMPGFRTDLRGATQYLDHIPWPEFKAYGSDHGVKMGKLALDLAERIIQPGNNTQLKRDCQVVQQAALLHDIGRTRDWQYPDEGHGERSALLADKCMRENPGLWGDNTLREDVCRLIAAHTLSGPVPTDPRLLALWDADLLEAARLSPKTVEGARVMNERFAKLASPWARETDTKMRWRAFRGWN